MTMQDTVARRSVLITGVGKPGQLGDALLRAFAKLGDEVFAIGRTLPEVEALVRGVQQNGGHARALAADLSDEAEVAHLISSIAESTNGRLDVLISAAGKFMPFGPVADGSLDTWRQTFADNLTSAFLVTRDALPLLRAAHGRIVYIASLVGQGDISPAQMADYAAAKAALVQLMRAVADEERGIVQANAIAPGGIKTAAMKASIGGSDIPGFVTPEAVAAVAVQLASSDSEDVTGTVVQI